MFNKKRLKINVKKIRKDDDEKNRCFNDNSLYFR